MQDHSCMRKHKKGTEPHNKTTSALTFSQMLQTDLDEMLLQPAGLLKFTLSAFCTIDIQGRKLFQRFYQQFL